MRRFVAAFLFVVFAGIPLLRAQCLISCAPPDVPKPAESCARHHHQEVPSPSSPGSSGSVVASDSECRTHTAPVLAAAARGFVLDTAVISPVLAVQQPAWSGKSHTFVPASFAGPPGARLVPLRI